MDPLLTSNPGPLGRFIVKMPGRALKAIFAGLMLIPMGIINYGGDFLSCAKDARSFIWRDEGDYPDAEPEVELPPVLSARAQKLYQRLLDGEFYPAYSDRTPQAMKELTDAGLVGIGGRVVTIAAFFVPSETIPFKMEEIRGRPL